MLDSIPDASWHVDANDPNAFTRLLGLPGLSVTRLESHEDSHLLILFLAHDRQEARCPACQQTSEQAHEYTLRSVRDLPWAGKPCLLEFTARRFYCRVCACPFREELDWLPRCSRLTARYREFVFQACRQTCLSAVSRQEQLGYKTVERLYYALAQNEQRTLSTSPVHQLGIDEFALKKGHDQFALALSDLATGRMLAILPDRKKETLLAYLQTWTPEQRAAVEEVAMDLWEPYARAVEACLPNARIVADRFHVMKSLTDHIGASRRELQRTLPPEAKSTLKGCRWLLLRNDADLSPADRDKLAGMFAVAPELAQLHGVKEAFRKVFEQTLTPSEAGRQLETWIASVQAGGLKKLEKFVATLRNRWEHILNYFHTRLTSGKVEGLNNKVKVIKRGAYGFNNFEHFALRILTECDGRNDHPGICQ